MDGGRSLLQHTGAIQGDRTDNCHNPWFGVPSARCLRPSQSNDTTLAMLLRLRIGQVRPSRSVPRRKLYEDPLDVVLVDRVYVVGVASAGGWPLKQVRDAGFKHPSDGVATVVAQ